jgi:hypothetical protein
VSGSGEEGVEEGEEDGDLALPGRVYYIKPRKVHNGATIKEVSHQVGRREPFCS